MMLNIFSGTSWLFKYLLWGEAPFYLCPGQLTSNIKGSVDSSPGCLLLSDPHSRKIKLLRQSSINIYPSLYL